MDSAYKDPQLRKKWLDRFNISKPELKTAKKQFMQVFPDCRGEYVDTPAVEEFIKIAPMAIVEYDGLLPHETKDGQGTRLKMESVYDGDLSKLFPYLRSLEIEDLMQLPKWGKIFKLYTMVIEPIEEVLKQAATQAAFSEPEPKQVAETKVDEPKAEESKVEETKVEETKVEAPIETPKQEVVPEPVVVKEEPKVEVPTVESSVTEATKVESVEQPVTESKVEKSAAKVETQPSGNVSGQKSEGFAHKNNNIFKEDMKMSDVVNTNNDALQNMMQAAKAGQVDANGNKIAPAAPKGVQSANLTLSEADAAKVYTEMYQNMMDDRRGWTQGPGVIEGIIVAQQPTVDRMVKPGDYSGKLFTKDMTDKEKTDAISAKITALCQHASGVASITLDKWLALDETARYANCVDKLNVKKAQAMYDMLDKMLAAPDGVYPAKEPKASYAVKGYKLAGGSEELATDRDKAVNIMDYASLLLSKGIGQGLVAGFYDAATFKPVADANGKYVYTVCKWGKKADAKKGGKGKDGNAQSAGTAQNQAKNKVLVVTMTNRSLAMSQLPMSILMNDIAEDESGKAIEGYAAFRAAINVDNDVQAASFAYFDLDAAGRKLTTKSYNDKKLAYDNKKRSGKKVGDEPTIAYKKRNFSVSVYVPVKKTAKKISDANLCKVSFDTEGAGSLDVNISYWGVRVPSAAAKGVNAQTKAFTDGTADQIAAKGIIIDFLKDQTMLMGQAQKAGGNFMKPLEAIRQMAQSHIDDLNNGNIDDLN